MTERPDEAAEPEPTVRVDASDEGLAQTGVTSREPSQPIEPTPYRGGMRPSTEAELRLRETLPLVRPPESYPGIEAFRPSDDPADPEPVNINETPRAVDYRATSLGSLIQTCVGNFGGIGTPATKRWGVAANACSSTC